MSTTSVEFDTHDTEGYKAGDNVTLEIHGSTSLTVVPVAGSYRVYSLSGHNEASGVLSDVMKIEVCSAARKATNGCDFTARRRLCTQNPLHSHLCILLWKSV